MRMQRRGRGLRLKQPFEQRTASARLRNIPTIPVSPWPSTITKVRKLSCAIAISGTNCIQLTVPTSA